MLIRLTMAASVLATLSMGLIAGFFFAFSNVVMPGLDQAPALAAIESMQAINRAVRNPVFFAVFAGPIITTILAAILLAICGHRRSAALMIGATICYILGVLLPTSLINVPMNNELATLAPTADRALAIWQQFSGPWTESNHWRTAVSAVCTVLAAMGIQRV